MTELTNVDEKPTNDLDEDEEISPEEDHSLLENEEQDEDEVVTAPERRPRRNSDARLREPTSFRRRVLYIALFLFSIFLAFSIHAHRVRKQNKSQIIYATRYSKEHKYRPAASPIITETLKDGRVRLRGATPPPPVPTPTPTTRKRRANRKRKSKKAAGGSKKKSAAHR